MKLHRLSREQERPLFNVENTVICLDLPKQPPQYVLDTLSLGPKNAVLDVFDQNDILTELDDLLRFCKKHELGDELMTDINVKTLTYIKNCKKQKNPRYIQMTRKYLKENGLIAVPFDKGIGICLMKTESYTKKLEDIINLPQFEKVTRQRKNEKHPILKEEERVLNTLKHLKQQGKISDSLYDKLKKTRSLLPSLKPPVDNALKSGLVYKITCSRCQSCYVGQTTRHLLTRFKEHKRSGTPVESHFKACNSSLTMDDVKIIAMSSKCNFKLMTLEALFIKDIKPSINTKDEFRSRALTIKI